MTTDIRAALNAAEQHATAEVWAGHPLAIILAALIKQTRDALIPPAEGEVGDAVTWLLHHADDRGEQPDGPCTRIATLLQQYAAAAAIPLPQAGEVEG